MDSVPPTAKLAKPEPQCQAETMRDSFFFFGGGVRWGVIGVDCAQEAMGSVTVCNQVLLYLPA